jgi:hypothetical protein
VESVVSTARWVIVVALIAAMTSGCAMIARAQSSPPSGTTPTDAERRECERNGGYWATAAGFCRIGA